MITIFLINLIANVGNHLLLTLFGNLIPTLNAISSYISNYSIPQTVYDVFSLVALFLPMGTIYVLFFMTITVIGIKLALSLIHIITLGLAFGE